MKGIGAASNAVGEFIGSIPGVFIDKMIEMIWIYNCTSAICFDEKRIYLMAG